MQLYVQIINDCAGTRAVQFNATHISVAVLLLAYGSHYDGDSVNIAVSDGFAFEGEAGSNAYNAAINQQYRRREGF